MHDEIRVERLFMALISGRRDEALVITEEALQAGESPEQVMHSLIWPVVRMLDQLERADQLSELAFRYGTETLRLIAARFTLLPRESGAEDQKGCVIVCAGQEPLAELTGQVIADLLEHAGYAVAFAAGGLPVEDLLIDIGERQPVALVIQSAAPPEAPSVRELIDRLRDVAACPNLRILIGGGVFGRAEGLAEEIGAEAEFEDPFELLEYLREPAPKRRSRLPA